MTRAPTPGAINPLEMEPDCCHATGQPSAWGLAAAAREFGGRHCGDPLLQRFGGLSRARWGHGSTMKHSTFRLGMFV